MKKNLFLPSIGLVILLILGLSTISHAQLRDQQRKSSELMGPVVKDRSDGANLGNLFNMKMSHSYSMMFSSFGGKFQNMNAYTNTMQFFFSEDLTGRVDISLLHSPFGNSYMSNSTGMDAQIVIRNAELNYQISDNSNISIQFQQRPNYGLNPWSGRYYQSPYNSPFTERNF